MKATTFLGPQYGKGNYLDLSAARPRAQPRRGIVLCDVIMGAMASQITSLTVVYSTVYSGTDQRKHQSSASLAIVRWIHLWQVNAPHKGPVTRKMFPFDDIIMLWQDQVCRCQIWPISGKQASGWDMLHPYVSIKFTKPWPGWQIAFMSTHLLNHQIEWAVSF